MLARATRSAAGALRAVPAAWGAGASDVPVRGMAESLAALRKRIKATANVAKLTGVMKMVASSKLKNAESSLAAARPFGKTLLDSLTVSDEGLAKKTEAMGEGATYKQLIVPMTTDRGLCGGVNSTMSRALAPYIKDQEAIGHDVSLFVLGEKGRAQIAKPFAEIADTAVDSAFDKEPIFPLAAAIAEMIVTREFDVLTVVYNQYINSASFVMARRHFPQLAGLDVGVLPEAFEGYEVEPENNEEALVNLMEFAVGGSLYYCLLENQACEISQRVISMDNASTNATDLKDEMELSYNRQRQASITTELSEINSGAAALEDEEE